MIVDLYAGPGGWDEGLRLLGLATVGIEWDAAACDTAHAAGHLRIQADVSTYCIEAFAGATGLVASPPCQAWSMAGKRAGEVDRARAHALVDAYADGADQPGGGWADDRSHHAAQPVRWVRDLRPRWVALEQVPPVLGLWQHIAERLRRWGYSTWTGVLNSADYGVPQTRERAFLLARLGGSVAPPEPTHARQPAGPDLLGSVRAPWVSMAEALGWVGVDRPARTVCGDRSPRWAYPQASSVATGWTLNRRTVSKGGCGSMYPTPVVEVERPAPTVTGQAGNQWVFERPATTVLGDPRIGRPGHKDRDGGESQFEEGALKVTALEATILQSFRPDYPWRGNKSQQFQQIGNAVPPLLAAAVCRALIGGGS